MKGELGVLAVHFILCSLPESNTFSISNQIKLALFGIIFSGDMDECSELWERDEITLPHFPILSAAKY